MATRRRRWPWVVLGIFVSCSPASTSCWATRRRRAPAYVIDLDALHRAAIVNGGALPERIEVEKVGEFAFPRTLVVAGDGFRMHPMVLLAHRVVWPDQLGRHRHGDGAGGHEEDAGQQGDAAAFDRVEAAMKKASAIVFTHEHVDHVGGVGRRARLPRPSPSRCA